MKQGQRVLIAVSLGGAVGALLRAEVERRLGGGIGTFPWSTLGINVVGSFGLGMVTLLTVGLRIWWVKPALGTGVLGGFTTFSSYVVVAHMLQLDGQATVALVYAVLTPISCVAAAWLGVHAPRLFGLPYGHAPRAREQE
ncbi:MAG: CrcB family protein [Ornithinimicrobium sp.]